MVGEATVTPPQDAQVCTSEHHPDHELDRARRHADQRGRRCRAGRLAAAGRRLRSETEEGRCSDKDCEILIVEAKERGEKLTLEDAETALRAVCRQGVHASSAAEPGDPSQVVDPFGNVTFHTVTTDANGCYEDFMASVIGGTWQVTAEYPGGRCEAPATEGPITVCLCR